MLVGLAVEDAMRWRWSLLALLAALSVAGCALPPRTHAVRTVGDRYPRYRGPVEISMATAPGQGLALAIVEVSGVDVAVDDLMPAFVKRVADEGGNFAKIDDVGVAFED